MSKVIVIGAGAAGMMAAIAAADQGAQVVLVEKMDQPGRKLRITGKGRCNLTNTAPLKDFLSHIGPDGRWMRNCFAQFFNTQLMDFFEQRNVPLVEERGHRVYHALRVGLASVLAVPTATRERHGPGVDIGERLEENSLALHHGDRRGRAKVAQAEDGRAV